MDRRCPSVRWPRAFSASSSFSNAKPPTLLYPLRIQDNSLTGPIPGFSQSGLTRFNVSNNKLSGEIPQTKTLQAVGLSSYQGNANLCGHLTPTLCSVKWQSLSEASSDQSSGGQSHGNGLFVAVLVVVDVLVVVIILLLLFTY
ncbi:hypothetical protein SASPL_119570 [Salvia splendens]|uniref:Somatic embryogenesis receptor kinase 1 n=1 Tax=Salvia splendens TaxID=180675 RepID=A0A8X8XRC4_SALSN|nr:hypothetical protein SASPL_119570 [Salvia splendens]